MYTTKYRLLGLALLCGALLAHGGAVHARPSTELAQIDRALADLPFGKGRDALQEWFKARLDREALTTIAAAADYAEKERLRAQRDHELSTLMKTEVSFDSSDPKWDVSLVAGEFGHQTGESMIVWRRPEETLYFFLRGGVLWKVARQLDLGQPFKDRVAHWKGVFRTDGAATASGSDEPTEVMWPRDTLDVRLVNRRLLYGGDLFIIQNRATANALKAAREAVAAASGSKKKTDDLDDFFLPENER